MTQETTEHVIWSITREILVDDLETALHISMDDVIATKPEFTDEATVEGLAANYAHAIADILGFMELGDMFKDALERALECSGLDLAALRAASKARTAELRVE